MRTRKFCITALLCLALVPAAFAQDAKKPAPAAPPAKMETMGKKSTPSTKKMPPRDPKTGRFIKAGSKMTVKASKIAATSAKMKKTMPPRDPKTGKFMKAAPKP